MCLTITSKRCRAFISAFALARYQLLHLLKTVKELRRACLTKSGIMVGLGETTDEVLQVMDDLRAAEVDL